MKRFFFILFALILMVMSLEMQRSQAATTEGQGPIPKESIRLRIIANSDSFQDQWLKRKVRDAIVAQMNVWAKDLESYDEAHAYVGTQVPELQKIVDNTIAQYGFTYKAEVDFGEVSFPTKLYGSYVYPAGEYEALRVRIGEAKGQNWWCVLFPPLCFIDMSNGDAVQVKETEQPQEEAVEEIETSNQALMVSPAEVVVQESNDEDTRNDHWMLVERKARIVDNVDNLVKENFQSDDSPAETQQEIASAEVNTQAPDVEIRFYLWDKLVAFF